MTFDRIIHNWYLGVQSRVLIFGLVIFGVLIIPMAAIGFRPDSSVIWIVVYGTVFASCWWLVFAPTQQQLIVAHNLRIPGITQTAIASFGLASLVLVVLPSLLFMLNGAIGFSAICAFHVCLVLGSFVSTRTFHIFGRSKSIWSLATYLPATPCLLSYIGLIPGVRDPSFGLWGWLIAGAFALVLCWIYRDTWRFRSLPFLAALGRAHVWQFLKASDGYSRNNFSETQLVSGTGVGRSKASSGAIFSTPGEAIRICLGGIYSKASILQIILTYSFAPVFMACILVLFDRFIFVNGQHYLNISIIFFQGSSVVWSGFIPLLQRVFVLTADDRAVLATMPGLGSGADLKNNVLSAVFVPLFQASIVQAVASLATILTLVKFYPSSLQEGFAPILFPMTGFLAAQAVGTSSAALRTLAGQRVRGWLDAVLGFILVIAAFIAGFATFGFTLGTISSLLMATAYFSIMAAITIDAWREFKRRPHPFLLSRRQTNDLLFRFLDR